MKRNEVFMLGIFKKTFFILISSILLINSAQAKSPPPGSGSADVPANILLMLDTSGSMAELLPGGDSRNPSDIAFDSAGNIYVAKYFDFIEKYDSAGQYLMTFGGEGTANGQFDIVYSIAIDSNDNIYVSDMNNARVQVFDTNGNYVRKFSTAGGRAYGVEVDSAGNVYVLNGNGAVEKFNSSGTRLQTWGNTNGRFLSLNSATNRIWVTRNSNRQIQQFDLNGNQQSSFTLSWNPLGIDVAADGTLFVSRNDNGRIYQLSTTGTQLNIWGSTGGAAGQFRNPRGVEISPFNSKVHVADYNNHRIQTNIGELIITNQQKTRLRAAQDVIKNIVSDSNLTSGANFGLMTWNSSGAQQMRVNISSSGAAQIFAMIDTLTANGGTQLNPAMNLAQSYFLGATSPRNPSAGCQQNILIVISDGFWFDDPDTIAQNLYNNYAIKTFAIGFATTGNENYISLSQAAGTFPDSPLYADDETGLLDALSDFIRQIISTQLSFTVPTIIPGITNSDHILQSTFLFKKDHQWKGRLYKYALNTDGSIGSLIWDAGDKLNQRTAASRNIWTVANSLTPSLNNFVATNFDRLKPPMEENSSVGMSDEALQGLINFIRGSDTYNEYPTGIDEDGDALITGERWKLADIYHSKAVAVGKPSAFYSDEANVKSESYYRAINGYQSFAGGSTCGGSCVTRPEVIYVGSNSGMLHAFDSLTGVEKWAFIPPGLLSNLRTVISTQAGKSISIYGVDGSPAVKDIKIGSNWRTVLFGGLRQGGNSYYALDITDPENPTHLFSFWNNRLANRVIYWNGTSPRVSYTTTNVPVEYNFFSLGESWSDPLILNISINGTRKWVGVFGGGYNNNVNGTLGNVVFVIDLEDGGKILQRINIPDSNSTNGIITSVVPRLTAITADTTTTFPHAGALVYFTDVEGNMWKINLTDSGTLYQTTRVFNAESTFDNDRLCYNELSPTILSDGRLMKFFGTADMNRIGRVGAAIANRAYGVIDPNYPNFVNVSSPFTISSMVNAGSVGAICPTSSQNGWYINLGANEKITAAATVRSKNVVFSRYTPDSNNICDSGTSKISEHDFGCGTNIRETNLGAGMATEAIVYKDKMYIGISSDVATQTPLPSGFVKQGNLIIGAPALDPETEVEIRYWKEDF
jgi:type IV pilus assembly protein PilY1